MITLALEEAREIFRYYIITFHLGFPSGCVVTLSIADAPSEDLGVLTQEVKEHVDELVEGFCRDADDDEGA